MRRIRQNFLAKDSDDDSSNDDDAGDADEVLYKMIDGERVPCTAEETAAIKAQWAEAAITAAVQQQINALRAQDLSTDDKIQCLMSAVNAIAQGQTVPVDLANQISNSCQIQAQIEVLNSELSNS